MVFASAPAAAASRVMLRNPGPATSAPATPSVATERGREVGGEGARVEPEPLAELHRDVRRPVAVVAVARALEGDVVGRDLARALTSGRPCEVEQNR